MYDDSAAGGMIIGIAIFYILLIAFFIFLYWKIWSKAGFAGAWALLMLVPLVNIGALIYLAFAEWPVQKRLKELEGGQTFS